MVWSPSFLWIRALEGQDRPVCYWLLLYPHSFPIGPCCPILSLAILVPSFLWALFFLPSFEYKPWGDKPGLPLALHVHSQALDRLPYIVLSMASYTPLSYSPPVIYHTNIRPSTTHCVPRGLVPLLIEPRDDPFLLHSRDAHVEWEEALICLRR